MPIDPQDSPMTQAGPPFVYASLLYCWDRSLGLKPYMQGSCLSSPHCRQHLVMGIYKQTLRRTVDLRVLFRGGLPVQEFPQGPGSLFLASSNCGEGVWSEQRRCFWLWGYRSNEVFTSTHLSFMVFAPMNFCHSLKKHHWQLII